MRGVIPILNMCANDGGFAFSTKSSQAGGSAVSISENTTCLCQKTQDNSAANSPSLTCFANSTLKWPKLTDVGWRYCKNSDSPALCSMAKGMLSDSSYVYQVTNGTDVVTCTFDTGNCQ